MGNTTSSLDKDKRIDVQIPSSTDDAANLSLDELGGEVSRQLPTMRRKSMGACIKIAFKL